MCAADIVDLKRRTKKKLPNVRSSSFHSRSVHTQRNPFRGEASPSHITSTHWWLWNAKIWRSYRTDRGGWNYHSGHSTDTTTDDDIMEQHRQDIQSNERPNAETHRHKKNIIIICPGSDLRQSIFMWLWVCVCVGCLFCVLCVCVCHVSEPVS